MLHGHSFRDGTFEQNVISMMTVAYVHANIF